MAVSSYVKSSLERSSWIRRMFEEGAGLKARYGAENVFDFSIGNPDIPPPPRFGEVLRALASSEETGVHGYMPNPGFARARKSCAVKASRDHGIEVPQENVIMSCGAAGGLNAVFKTILDPGDEVIVPAPYFVEYNFYAENHGGRIVPVKTGKDFSPDIEAIEKAIGGRTKAVLINSPNNPTGAIYSAHEIESLASLLKKHSEKDRVIYLISDEPYREIVYDGTEVPGVLDKYPDSIAVTSYSKTLSLPGERIGYIAVSPLAAELKELLNGLTFSTRILGYVNAPALMQRAVAELNDEKVNVAEYRARRDLLAQGLADAGYGFFMPRGAFYFFCSSPYPDEIAFVNHLKGYNILAVPGSGFGAPGYFRLSFCVPADVIKRSLPVFAKALEEYRAKQ